MAVAKKIQVSMEKSSWIRKMFEEGIARKAKFGAENVFDFSLGNPNLEPPVKFKKTLIDLSNDPSPALHAYMPNAGLLATRKAVAAYLSENNSQTFSPEEIVMTVGAGGHHPQPLLCGVQLLPGQSSGRAEDREDKTGFFP
jgi:aspartate aminotransferase